jgi:hypothetical protein
MSHWPVVFFLHFLRMANHIIMRCLLLDLPL